MSINRQVRAAIGTAAFLVVAPGVVTGLVPWLMTGWRQGSARPAAMVAAGAVLTAAGCLVLLQAFGRFALEGVGTPAPPAPTDRLVVGGLYRYVRNPMYLALQAVIIGQVLLLDRPVLLYYAAAVLALTVAFVRLYEEPALARKYGEQYAAYRRAVPGWLPRWPSKR
ncbi:MAG TPA: isoprenylcysteine carboxylmethyltransferase family protein [Streptosporangiaceae bacterium]|nr:isoprenylcysteine carboxylmethyltransferase family protein [Streptosporangiaceae bacterium]